MYFAVLDPLKYIVFCGLRNYDELSSKPVSIHEKLFKCACSNLCVNFEKNIVLTVKLLYLNSTKACYNIQGWFVTIENKIWISGRYFWNQFI